jgi:hypothetical protein
VVYIERSYAGVIQLDTKKGKFEFLPGVAEHMQIVKSTDTEALALYGKQTAPSSTVPSDFCRVTTHSGTIIMGLRGIDKYVPEPGFWQRMGGYLKGGDTEPSRSSSRLSIQ